MKPFLMGVAGGTCCGKSEVCRKICSDINVAGQQPRVIVLGHKHFYRALNNEEQEAAKNGDFNFDHPSAFDERLALQTMQKLKEGKVVSIPKYNFVTHSREEQSETITPADVILLEGILVLYNKELRDLLDMKIFVDTDCDTRLARRVLRDTVEHQRDIESVLKQYTRHVKRAFEDFTLPTKKYADVIIPRGLDNSVAIELIVEHVCDILKTSPPATHQQQQRVRLNSGSRPH